MQRDAERLDRFTKAVGGDLLASLVDEWTAIGRNAPVERSCLTQVAAACRQADVPPEAMLVAVRVLSRSFFEHGTLESDRIEQAWNPSVRLMMSAYYPPMDAGA